MDSTLLTDIASGQKVLMNQVESLVKTQEKHSDKLDEISVTLLRNTITVEEHEKRSTNLETQQTADRTRIAALEDAAKDAKSRSKQNRIIFGSIAAAAAGLGTISGLFGQIYQLMKKLGL